MFKIKMEGSGLFAFLKSHGTGVRTCVIADIVAQAQGQAFVEWCERSGDVSLAVRFEPRGFGLKRFTERSKGYQTKQRKWMGGQTTPYVSPRVPELLAVAKAITAPHRNARRILQALATRHEHARDVVRTRGTGFNVRTTGGTRVVRTKLTLPGLRQLNQIRAPKGDIYRREFLGFNAGGKADGLWIRARAQELALTRVIAYIKHQRRRLLGEGS